MPESPDLIRTVAIVGPGLIGGSFALALRQAGFTGVILGVGASPYVERALAVKAIDRIATLSDAAAVSNLIYLAEPVDVILKILGQLPLLVRHNCLVTDAGSTKRTIVQKAADFTLPITFMGGHPMAGKEKRGVEHAEATLFNCRPYILTSRPKTGIELEFVRWLGLIGARVVYLDPHEHDRAVALSSHLPQLLSTALALMLSRSGNSSASEVAGPGLQQMTRLARSTPSLWLSILHSNQDEVISAIDSFVETLAELRGTLSTPEITELFVEAGKYSYLLSENAELAPRS